MVFKISFERLPLDILRIRPSELIRLIAFIQRFNTDVSIARTCGSNLSDERTADGIVFEATAFVSLDSTLIVFK